MRPIDYRNIFVLFFLAFIIAFWLLSCQQPLRSEEVDWWHLTVDLNAKIDLIKNKPDRKFLRQMLNELSVASDSVPQPWQQKWLLSIKTELDRRKR